MTTLMTDYQAPYATPRDDDLTTRITELVTLLREAEARARARQAAPPSTVRQAESAVKTALDIVLRSAQRWQAGEANPCLTTTRVEQLRHTATEDVGVLVRALRQLVDCDPRPRYKQQARAHLDALQDALGEAWEVDCGG
jgi:hypothetical protein